ncbi:hypothetical protein GCM10020001_026000 [Nonomuraea salmonea]
MQTQPIDQRQQLLSEVVELVGCAGVLGGRWGALGGARDAVAQLAGLMGAVEQGADGGS